MLIAEGGNLDSFYCYARSVLSLGFGACKDSSDPISVPAIARIVISPSDPVTSVGAKTQLSATAYGFEAKGGLPLAKL